MPLPDVQSVFKSHFGCPPVHRVSVPGRLELLGHDAGQTQGLAMAVAVNRFIHLACAPRNDGKIELASAAVPQRELFWATNLARNPRAPWADYCKVVLDHLRRRGVHFSGFNAAMQIDAGMGAGLGSLAALEVAVALSVRRLYPFSLTETGVAAPPGRDAKGQLPPLPAAEKWHLARLCQAAVASFAGAQPDLLEALCSLCGKAWQVMTIDFRSLSCEQAPLIGVVLVLCDTGTRPSATLAASREDIRRHSAAAAAQLGVRSLRAVELRALRANKSKLTPREYECAAYVAGETARVVAAERALREEDHAQFGQYLSQSDECSREFLGARSPELELLLELARAHPGCLGTRVTGGGFSGAAVSLVRHHQAESFLKHLASAYQERTGTPLHPVLCQVVDGAG